MDAWELLTDVTIKAVFLIAQSKQIDLEGKNAEIAESLKTVVKGQVSQILGEWKDVAGSNLGRPWLKELMIAQASELAVLTLKHMGEMT